MNCNSCKFQLDLKNTNANGMLKDEKICLNNNNADWTDCRVELIVIDKELENFIKEHGCPNYEK